MRSGAYRCLHWKKFVRALQGAYFWCLWKFAEKNHEFGENITMSKHCGNRKFHQSASENKTRILAIGCARKSRILSKDHNLVCKWVKIIIVNLVKWSLFLSISYVNRKIGNFVKRSLGNIIFCQKITEIGNFVSQSLKRIVISSISCTKNREISHDRLK